MNNDLTDLVFILDRNVPIAQNFCTVSCVASNLCASKSVSNGWKNDIDKNYKKSRKK